MEIPKIFISHAYKDKLLVNAFVNMLTKAGVPESQIVCSSTPGTQLNAGSNLYSELRKELTNDNVYVIFMLSENFYASPVCLNEMGAVWIRGSKCQVILLPGFSFEEMKGVIREKSLIGIALDTYDEATVDRFNQLRGDLVKHEFTLSLDKWNIAMVAFFSAVECYKKQLAGEVTLDMTDVKCYCIDDTKNDGCQVIEGKSSKAMTTTVVDFDKTTSKLCSVVYRIEQKNWTSMDKNKKSLCFEAYANIQELRVEVELHLADREEQVPIVLTGGAQSFCITLSHFTSSTCAWKEVKEVCFLFRKEYINDKTTVVIENLRLED